MKDLERLELALRRVLFGKSDVPEWLTELVEELEYLNNHSSQFDRDHLADLRKGDYA
jgi:hypothetical protein